MEKQAAPHIADDEQLKKLRTALAISQGTKLLYVLKQEAESTVSHNQIKRVSYLTSLFSKIHREIFHHWQQQATTTHRPGTMNDANKRQAFRKTIGQLVLDNDEHQETAIFDNNGFVIQSENIAERLADFYLKMRAIRPFDYGNRLTLDFFMTVLGRLPAFKAVYEQSIDFRRLKQRDSIVMHDSKGSLYEVITAFEHALDPTRNRNLANQANGYGIWPENKKFISGISFLSHTMDDKVPCLVTINGGLVPIETIEENLFLVGNHLADYPLCKPENIIGYLPNTESLRSPDKTDIDGIAIGENGVAPLFCLDVNILTGLSSASHAELDELLKQCAGNKTSVFKLANNERLKKRLLANAKGERRLRRTVEIAYERLSKMVNKLEAAKEGIFAGKTPVENPQLFMSMGGAGSGKTAVEEIAHAQCGDNFVIASLDEFRKQSDLYIVLTAANHHSDDYVYVEPFANYLRDLVAKHARELGFNLLYDGTGIPFRPRYSEIVNQFKASGFDTQVVAVDAFIVKPQGREEELQRSGVVCSVKSRYEETGRALPWVVTVYKHLRAPRSFLHAIEEPCLDKISLFANDGEKDQHYLVAENFNFSEGDVEELQQQQKQGTLIAYLTSQIKTREGSVLKNLAQGNEEEIDKLMARNPAFEEANVAYQIYSNENGARVLLIYNTRRMVDFVEKRQLNPNASGEAGLLHKIDVLAFHIDPENKEPWLIRLQDSVVRK
ncbi:MAG: toxin [Methylococcaceae bacterium]|nr:toxin [Methylococcaceae bacterium]